MRFVSISVTTQFLGVAQFVFSKLPRAKPVLDIFGGVTINAEYPPIPYYQLKIIKYPNSNGLFSARNLSHIHF
jgi:hypothetical protein